MKRIIWVRHGKTNVNQKGRYLGHYDEPLNEEGKKDVKKLAIKLCRYPIDRIYTSDLQRCVQTATMISQYVNTSPIKTACLRELNFGKWDLKSYEELRLMDKDRLFKWYDDPLSHAPLEGETLTQLGKRIDQWLHGLLEELPIGQTALVVSHGGPIRWFQCKWIEKDPAKFWDVDGVKHSEAMITVYQGQYWSIEEFLNR